MGTGVMKQMVAVSIWSDQIGNLGGGVEKESSLLNLPPPDQDKHEFGGPTSRNRIRDDDVL